MLNYLLLATFVFIALPRSVAALSVLLAFSLCSPCASPRALLFASLATVCVIWPHVFYILLGLLVLTVCYAILFGDARSSSPGRVISHGRSFSFREVGQGLPSSYVVQKVDEPDVVPSADGDDSSLMTNAVLPLRLRGGADQDAAQAESDAVSWPSDESGLSDLGESDEESEDSGVFVHHEVAVGADEFADLNVFDDEDGDVDEGHQVGADLTAASHVAPSSAAGDSVHDPLADAGASPSGDASLVSGEGVCSPLGTLGALADDVSPPLGDSRAAFDGDDDAVVGGFDGVRAPVGFSGDLSDSVGLFTGVDVLEAEAVTSSGISDTAMFESADAVDYHTGNYVIIHGEVCDHIYEKRS